MNTKENLPNIILNPGTDRILAPFPDDRDSRIRALDHLCALIPAGHAARDPFEHLRSKIQQENPVSLALINRLCNRIRYYLTDDPIAIQVIDNPKQLKQFQHLNGIRSTWHEPDEQSITTLVTIGTFDNCVGEPHYLEQWVFFCDTSNDDSGPVPIAAANLANLCAWATMSADS